MKSPLFSNKQYFVLFSIIICTFFYSFSYGTALSGTYTIGGSSPSYSTLTTAVSALTTNGVSGPVTFNIRSGTYSEHVSIGAITGTSSTNTVTFQSETGTNTDVIVSYSAATSNNNYVIKMNGADYVTFKNMTIQATGTSYAYVVTFNLTSDNNKFDNNKIIAGATSNTVGYGVYCTTTTLNQNNQFTNNTFENGSYGIYYNGQSTSSYASGITISNNTFSGQYNGAIILQYVSSAQILSNTITENSTATYYTAISIAYSSGGLIEKNKVTISDGYGINLYALSGSASSYALVDNNFIEVSGSSTNTGISMTTSGSYVKICYNSINLYGTATGYKATGLYLSGTISNVLFNNNIYYNAGGGYAIYVLSTSTTLTSCISDYNNLYTSGSTLAYWKGTACSSLSTWQTASALDAKSVNSTLTFTSSTDLHTSSSSVADKGTPITEVTTDIDGATRSTGTPDIGADETVSTTYDAGLTAFVSPAMLFAAGSQSVSVTLSNNCSVVMTSATINWTVNGVAQTAYSYSGSMAIAGSATVALGNYTFVPGTAYTISATVSSPNGQTDATSTNNTVTSSTLYAACNGTYTVGTSGDFASLTSAISALQNGGMLGAVTLNLKTGTYSEQVSIPQITGSSSTNTLTIQSQTGTNTDVIVSYAGTSTANYVIQLNGADYVTVQKIKLQNTSTTYSRVFEFTNGANYNTLSNCLIYGGSSSSTSTELALVYSGSSYLNENNTITNNTIQTGAYGIYYLGTSSTSASGITVTSNTISSVKNSGISMNYVNAAVISQNTITGYAYSSFYGITIAGNNGIKIEKNKISGGYGYGISLSNLNGTATDYALIDNNFVQVGGTSTCKGIRTYNSTYLKIYYNNVNITGTASSSSAAAFYYDNNSTTPNLKIYNNIFANTGGGYVAYSYTTLSAPSSTFDYNDYYTSSSTKFMNWHASDMTYASWKTYDTHAVNANPTYTSSTDLHAAATEINNVATPLAEVTTDIDGETRNTTNPDIGADELALATYDAGITALISPAIPFAAGSQNVSVTLLNNSASALTSATISWSVNGVSQTAYHYSGSIAAGSNATVTLGTYSFSLGTGYTIVATASSPNGNTDVNSANDAVTSSNLYPGYSGTYTIGSSGATFSSLTDAVTKLQYGGLLGAVTLNIASATYNEQISIAEIPGASSTNKITFQSTSGLKTDVTISYDNTSAKNYVVQLNGADYITFKNLTIKSVGSSAYGRVVEITGGSNYNTFDGNNLIGLKNINAVIYCYTGSSNQYNTFSNNVMQYGDYGIYYWGQDNSTRAAGLSITNNTITDQGSGGIYLYYVSGPVITGNTITPSSNLYSYKGIALTLSSNGFQISSNKITESIGYGIYLSYADGTSASYALLSNNFIQTGNYVAGSTIYSAYGLYMNGSDYVNVYYNSINFEGTESPTNCYAAYINDGSNLKVKNNIFANNSGGYSIYLSASSVISICNYNDYYVKGTNVAKIASTDYTSLSTWKTATGFDANSYQYNPQFTSSTDLHLNQYLLNNTGTTVTEVTTDIDGTTRNSSTPDIGADETSSLTALTDIGINAILSPSVTNGLSESSTVQVRVENMGSVAVSGIKVGYSIDNGTPVTESISGTLNAGDKIDYTFAAVPSGLAALKSLPIKAYTILSSDAKSSDDTLSVTLEWLSDLEVSDITIASSFTLAQNLELSWTVENNGNGSTGSESWYDNIWLSTDEDLRYSDDVLLTSLSNLTYLQAGQSYDQSTSIAIPSTIKAGTYYVFVTSDMYDAYCLGSCYDGCARYSHVGGTGNHIDELYEDNNYKYATISLTNPNAPDLQVSSVAVPSSAYSGTTVSLTYTVQNKGAASITSGSWKDYIYISSSSTFDASTATYLGSYSNSSVSLAVNASYSNTQNITIPNAIYGTYYVYVTANADASVNEYANTYSNTTSSSSISITLTPPANLVPTAITVPSTGNSGQDLSVSWTVKNNGSNAPYESLWNDKIYISTSSTFDANTATLLGTYYKTSGTSLSVGTSYTETESYTLPNGISGNYYVYVVADADNMVYEYNSDNDNTLKSTSAVVVSLSASPDLTIPTATTDATMYAAYSTSISWSVKNQGSATAASYINAIYLSTDNILDSKDELLDTVKASTLAANQTASLSTTITFDDDVAIGTYYIIISTDYDDAVYEYNGESNNTISKSVSMTWKYADLNISSFTAPSSVTAGNSISASWTIQNIGSGKTYEDLWADYVYLSNDNVYDANDTKLKTTYKNGVLDAGASYSQSSVSISIPNNVSGNYYLILVTDASHTVDNETATSNNYLSQAIGVSGITPSDLIVSNATVPSSFYAGEKISISYTIKNQGTGTTETGNWYTGIYISNTPDLSDEYKKLTQKKASTTLSTNASYSSSMDVTIPSYYSGNYYIIVMADCNDDLYESSNESNNLNASLRNILVTNPSDLIVTAITMPSSIILGNSASVSYTIKNNGSSTVVGDLRDIAYLSSDNALDGSIDKMINYYDQTISLAAGNSATYSLSGQVTDVIPGSYYGILNTNALNSISETSTSNNTLASSSTSTVSVNALMLGTASSSNLQVDNNIYYKVDVSANKDLQLKVASNQSEGYNEMYVAYNRIPSETDYDFMQEEDGINPEVLVPSTQSGTYYIMIKTLSMFSSTQTISVLAQELSFQILNIDPSTVGQGVVTCNLKGAGFRTGMQVYLKSGSATVAMAEIRKEVSSMEFTIRWSLTNVAVGAYDIVAVNTDNSTVSLSNGLTVEPAKDFNIKYVKYAPENIWKGHSAFYTYKISNVSNVDIPYFMGYFMFDSTIQVSQAKVNDVVYNSRYIDPVTKDPVCWIYIGQRKYIPIHFVDMQPNKEVKLDFTLTNFISDADSFNFVFAYTTFDRQTYINNHLASADSVREKILSDVSASTKSFGSAIVNRVSDQTKFREIYFDLLYLRGALSGDDLLSMNYSSIITNSNSSITSKQNLSSKALGTNTTDDCYVDEGQKLAEITARAISDYNQKMADILEYIEKLGLGEGGDLIMELSELTAELEDAESYEEFMNIITNGDNIGTAQEVDENTLEYVFDVDVDEVEVPGTSVTLEQIAVINEILDMLNALLDAAEVDENLQNADAKPVCNPENDPSPHPPHDPAPTGGDNHKAPWWKPWEPNEIIGPAGIGEKHWVSVNDNLSYTIYTENDSDATAPAQYIKIEQQLDAHVDPYSFRLGKYGFANMSFDVPENSITYSTTLDLVDTLGVDVEVTAGLDIVNNSIFWIFNAIDPNTGKTPIDPNKGILIPNDSTNAGQGFVIYSIKPASTCNTGDTIFAYADNTFDINEPIRTATIYNIVDAHAPVTSMTALAASYTSPAFTLNWSGADDAGKGCGIYDYDVYFSRNGAAYELYTENTSAASVDYTGSSSDVSLSFYVVAIDSVGNQETKSVADVTTSIGSISLTSPNGGESSCASGSRTITWSSSNVSSFNLYYSTNGTSYTSIASNVTGSSYNWSLPSTSGSYWVKVANASNANMYDVSNASFTINALPSASITSSTGSSTNFCTSATLTASSASSYLWSTGSAASSISITASGTYTVTVTNASGCTASASKTMTKLSKPTANYTYTTPSAKKAVFTNTSTGATSYSWNFGDATTSTATSPSHTYSAGGTYSVVLTATNTCGSGTKTQSVTVSSTKTLNINEIGDVEGDEVLWLYPNPVINIANIDVNVVNQESDVEVNVINVNGQIVETLYKGKLNSGKHSYQWDTNKFTSGIYFIKISIDNEVYQKQLVVVKN